jgi:hypothetical protein
MQTSRGRSCMETPPHPGADLNGSEVTNIGARYLSGLSELVHLNIARSSIDEAGLQFLESTPKIASLVLSGCPVTGNGYAAGPGSHQLRWRHASSSIHGPRAGSASSRSCRRSRVWIYRTATWPPMPWPVLRMWTPASLHAIPVLSALSMLCAVSIRAMWGR